MLKILVADAPTGSGKTTALVKNTITMLNDNKTVLFIQPTRALNRETAERFASFDPTVHIQLINGDTHPQGAVGRLAEHLRQPLDQPHAIITTHESFERIPYRSGMERYDLICDEIPKAFKSSSAQLPHNHGQLTGAITVIQKGPSYGEVVAADEGHLRRIAENKKGDSIDGILQPFARTVLDPNYRTFVSLEQYENLKKGRSNDPHLRMFSLLEPKLYHGFNSVRLAGARANETILYKWFTQLGVVFEEDDAIQAELRYLEHTNGPLIDFYYGSETNWSLYAQDQDPDIRQRILNAAKDIMKDKKFCWLDNKIFEENHPLKEIEGSRELPHASHGRNDFQDEDNAVLLHAFNYDPFASAFLENVVGLSRTEQKVAFDYHNTYQTLSRLSVRDPNNTNRKIIVLPDRQNAEWQALVFPGSRVRSLNVDKRIPKKTGRKSQYENSTERKRANRKKNELEQMQLVEKYELGTERIREAGFHMSCHETAIESLIENVTTYQGSKVNGLFKSMSFPIVMNNKDFGIYMNGLHKRRLMRKEDNELIMPALCVPVEGVDSERAYENAIFGRHIYLDIENGQLTDRRLSQIFPYVEMIVYNSYNHTPELPRYRVVFLTEALMMPTVYKFLWRQIVQTIENSGFYDAKSKRPKGDRKVHGIDNKPNIVNLFFLPCEPKKGEGFYRHYKTNRKPLCIANWIGNAIPTRFDDDDLEEQISLNDVTQANSDSSITIQYALERYRNAINSYDPAIGKLGSSNKEVYKLNKALIRAGVDRWERSVTLIQAANESRSKIDRLRDVRRYLNKE